MIVMVCMCEMIIFPGVFLKRQKMVHDDKKMYPLRSMSQEPYMNVIYGTHV